MHLHTSGMLNLPFDTSRTSMIIRRRKPSRWRRRVRRWGFALFCMLFLLGAAIGIHPYTRRLLGYARPPACYVVPVSGVRARDLVSTFGAPRPGGRKHKGVDIFADRGTAVLSATDGVVWKVGRNRLGGNVVWVFGEGLSLYYYAHLDAWAPGLGKGDHVRAGEPLGAIGNSGNARTTPTHLHFSVSRLSLMGHKRSVDPAAVLSQGRTMPAFRLENPVTRPGDGQRPAHGGLDWSGNPCDLPRFASP